MIGILIFDYFRPGTKTVYEIPFELQLLMESRQREREQTLKPKHESKSDPLREPILIPIPPEVKALKDLNIWKLGK
jgi:hypothetical protein